MLFGSAWNGQPAGSAQRLVGSGHDSQQQQQQLSQDAAGDGKLGRLSDGTAAAVATGEAHAAGGQQQQVGGFASQAACEQGTRQQEAGGQQLLGGAPTPSVPEAPPPIVPTESEVRRGDEDIDNAARAAVMKREFSDCSDTGSDSSSEQAPSQRSRRRRSSGGGGSQAHPGVRSQAAAGASARLPSPHAEDGSQAEGQLGTQRSHPEVGPQAAAAAAGPSGGRGAVRSTTPDAATGSAGTERPGASLSPAVHDSQAPASSGKVGFLEGYRGCGVLQNFVTTLILLHASLKTNSPSRICVRS